MLANGMPAVLGLLSFRLLATGLGPSELSGYVLIIAVFGMYDQLRSGILSNAYVKMTSGRDEQQDLIGGTWTASLFMSVLLLVVLGILSILDSRAQPLVLPIFLISLITVPSFVATLVRTSKEQFQHVALLRTVRGVVFVGLLLIQNQYKMTYLTAIWALVAAELSSSLLAYFLKWTHVQYAVRGSKSSVLTLWKFGKFTSGTQLITSLIVNTDLFVLRIVVGPSSVGIYEAGKKLLELFEVPMRSLGSLYYSRLSAMVNQGQSSEVWTFITKRAVRTSIILGSVGAVSFYFAPELILLVAGEEFSESIPVFRVLVILSLILPFDRFYGMSLDALGLPKRNFQKGIILFVVNLCLDVLILQFYPSATSVAIVSLVFYAIGSVLSLIWLKREVGRL